MNVNRWVYIVQHSDHRKKHDNIYKSVELMVSIIEQMNICLIFKLYQRYSLTMIKNANES
jgi:hypothetical protein